MNKMDDILLVFAALAMMLIVLAYAASKGIL